MIFTEQKSREAVLVWARDSLQGRYCGYFYREDKKTLDGTQKESNYDRLAYLMAAHFMPNHANINLLRGNLNLENQTLQIDHDTVLKD